MTRELIGEFKLYRNEDGSMTVEFDPGVIEAKKILRVELRNPGTSESGYVVVEVAPK